jgi:hypothetical protein
MATPEELRESALIFLTTFFTHLMQSFEDPAQLVELFRTGITSKRRMRRRKDADSFDDEANKDEDDGPARPTFGGDSGDEDGVDNDELEGMDEGDALRASLLVFFVQVLKSSPEYGKTKDRNLGTADESNKFRRNLKAAIKACDVGAFF